MNGITLTFAELAYLLADEQTVRARLQLADTDCGEALFAAGISSLVARGIVVPTETGLEPLPQLAALLAKVTDATSWIEIGVARDGTAAGFQFFDGPWGRARAVAHAYGTFTVHEVAPQPELPTAVVDIVADALSASEPTAIFLRFEPAPGDSREMALRAVEPTVVEISYPPTSDAPERIDLGITRDAVASFLNPAPSSNAINS